MASRTSENTSHQANLFANETLMKQKRLKRSSVAGTSSNEEQKKGSATNDPDPEIIRCMDSIRNVLGRDYVDVVRRIKLNWTPYCVEDVEYCRAHHHRKCPSPRFASQLQTSLVTSYTKYNRTMKYLRAIQDMCIRGEFPGAEPIKKVLEIILISKQSPEDQYSTEFIVQHCVIVAKTVVMGFPPCWMSTNGGYKDVLLGGVDVKKYYSCDAGSEPISMFSFIMDLLIETVEKPEHSQSTNTESDEESMVLDWDDWLKKNIADENFWQHTRQEQLDRLFAVLEIYVTIMEHDLSIWILRYPHKTRKAIQSDKAPLVVVGFFNDTYNVHTVMVRKLVDVFITCICLQFPKSAIDVLARLMNVVSVAIACCEEQPHELVSYPNIGNKTHQYTQMIFKAILDKGGDKIKNFLLVIQHVHIPSIKYILIDQLLTKLDPQSVELNVAKIFLLFKRKRWQCREGKREITTNSSLQKYPQINHQRQRKSEEIFVHEYLSLVLDFLRAYCETYQIREVILRAFANKPFPTALVSSSAVVNANRKRLSLRDINNEQAYAEILERTSDFNGRTEVPYTSLYVNGKTYMRYRNDIKYLGILRDHIKRLHASEPHLFKDLYQFLLGLLNV